MKSLTVLLSLTVFVMGCQSQKQLVRYDDSHLDKERMEYLKANMEFLASDELEGREAGTNGERVAAGLPDAG